MKIALVIPCYNEAKRLNIKKFLSHKEINFIFVDDGSSDDTFEIIKKMEGTNISILKLPTNQGKAEAVRIGMLEALKKYKNSEWVGFWDADLATSLEQISYMIRFADINNNQFDSIFGNRVLRLGANIQRSFTRHVFGRLFVTYSSIILGSHAYDSQCGAKLFKTAVIEQIFTHRFISKWFFDMEIIQRMSLANLKVLECPLQEWIDVEGSKIHPFSDGLKAFWDVLKIRKKYGKIQNH